MTAPVRLQLSRAKGFNLQTLSLQINGLPAVNVTRSGRLGNPYRIGETIDPRALRMWGWHFSDLKHVCSDAHEAVARFSHALFWDAAVHDWLRREVGGKNVACFCGLGEPCHGDPILAIANSTREQIDQLQYAIDQRLMAETEAFAEMATP